MKLHLPTGLLTLVISAMNFAAAENHYIYSDQKLGDLTDVDWIIVSSCNVEVDSVNGGSGPVELTCRSSQHTETPGGPAPGVTYEIPASLKVKGDLVLKSGTDLEGFNSSDDVTLIANGISTNGSGSMTFKNANVQALEGNITLTGKYYADGDHSYVTITNTELIAKEGSVNFSYSKMNSGSISASNGEVNIENSTVSVSELSAQKVNIKEGGELNVNGECRVESELTLGVADDATTLIVTGALSTQGITLGNIASSASAEKLLGSALNLTVADSELQKLAGGSRTVLTLGTVYDGTITLNGGAKVLSSNGKMMYTLVWQAPATGTAAATSLVLQYGINPEYVQDKIGEQVTHYSCNGRAGLRILNAAYAEHNPQQNAAGGALAALVDTVEAGKMTDADLAAVAGASTAVLGQVLSSDVERQLRAIRNRAAMGNHAQSKNSVILDEKGEVVSMQHPSCYFAWVNAEGNRAEQNNDGTAAGYTLSSWGGTVGAGMQVNDKLTLGLALTAMYGDLKSDGPDCLDGDMDTSYMSAFARYESGKWNHAFIGTVGTMEADYKRSVSHATDNYRTYGDTDGYALGLMYEVSRNFTLGSKGTLSPVFNISYRHAEVDGYRESGADSALNVGAQSLDTVTVGLGARYAAVVGEQAFNRACHVETRALVKYDFGDTQNNIGVGFVNQASRANIESAEAGAFGVELGAGISVPVGSGSIFADGAVELRSDYTNFNATVGYRMQF